MSAEFVLLGICVGRGCGVIRVGLGGRRDVRSVIAEFDRGERSYYRNRGQSLEDPWDSKIGHC